MKFSLLLLAATALLFPAPALAVGGSYTFVGGTRYEQQQVRSALSTSSFNWSVVPEQITINIAPGNDSEAIPGTIYLSSGLLDSGMFSWGVVDHEYGHEVDFYVLTDQERAELAAALGTSAWWYADSPNLDHSDYGCERFASTLAFTYWPSSENSMSPRSIGIESGAISPHAFAALLNGMLSGTTASAADPQRLATRQAVTAPRRWKPRPSAAGPRTRATRRDGVAPLPRAGARARA